MPRPFRAWRLVEEHGRSHGEFVETSLDELSPGDVVVRGAFSSVNYKDALAGTGAGRIVRRSPVIGGIDVSGVVESSTDARFSRGDEVLVHGYDLGVSHDGGYAATVRVPGDWVVPMPVGLTLFESMALGTAGFTAALSIVRMEQMGLTPDRGPVAVTGATGGVGSIAIAALTARGYEVTAITGKDEAHEYLRNLGARAILSRHSLVLGTRPLEKATWAGAVDAVGGDMLAWLTRTTRPWGTIASTGLAGGVDLHTTVMPFILRGISLLGIDSAYCPMPVRRDVWRRLATDLKPAGLDRIATVIDFDELPSACRTLVDGRARGRFVVRLPSP